MNEFPPERTACFSIAFSVWMRLGEIWWAVKRWYTDPIGKFNMGKPFRSMAVGFFPFFSLGPHYYLCYFPSFPASEILEMPLSDFWKPNTMLWIIFSFCMQLVTCLLGSGACTDWCGFSEQPNKAWHPPKVCCCYQGLLLWRWNSLYVDRSRGCLSLYGSTLIWLILYYMHFT